MGRKGCKMKKIKDIIKEKLPVPIVVVVALVFILEGFYICGKIQEYCLEQAKEYEKLADERWAAAEVQTDCGDYLLTTERAREAERMAAGMRRIADCLFLPLCLYSAIIVMCAYSWLCVISVRW